MVWKYPRLNQDYWTVIIFIVFILLEWRTQLQPIVVVSEEVSGPAEAEEAIEEIEVVAEWCQLINLS